jgi:hypothetical protein
MNCASANATDLVDYLSLLGHQPAKIRNTEMTNDSFKVKFDYVLTKEVVLTNVTTASGQPLRVSNNMYMFRNVKLKVEKGM